MSSNARIDRRRAILLKIAKHAGYGSWYKFETAVINGKVELQTQRSNRENKKTKAPKA